MKVYVKGKLEKIGTIWNNYILESKLCQEQIKLENNQIPPHFGSILGHFMDTFDIVYDEHKGGSYTSGFINDIGFLQTIFVHQDLVRELLEIFQVTSNLWDDENYSINRNIRNELIGHPVSRSTRGNKALISSTLFSYQSDPGSITYLRYHKDNQYKFEKMSFKIEEIIERHTDFLNEYFDKILMHLKEILVLYQRAVGQFETELDSLEFNDLLDVASIKYESIFNLKNLYDKESLKIVYSKRSEHLRYKNLINRFMIDLKRSLKERKRSIKMLFNPLEAEDLNDPDSLSEFRDITNSARKSYQPALGKLGARDGSFDLESGILKSECEGNLDIVNELDHMRVHIKKDIEYYCAYFLICSILEY